MRVAAVKANGDATVLFELADAALDEIALLVEFTIVGNRLRAIGFGQDNRLYFGGKNQGTDRVGFVASISDYRPGFFPANKSAALWQSAV